MRQTLDDLADLTRQRVSIIVCDNCQNGWLMEMMVAKRSAASIAPNMPTQALEVGGYMLICPACMHVTLPEVMTFQTGSHESRAWNQMLDDMDRAREVIEKKALKAAEERLTRLAAERCTEDVEPTQDNGHTVVPTPGDES